MMLIFNLTLDVIRDPSKLYGYHAGAGAKRLKFSDERKILHVLDAEIVRCEQILTEYGICYVSNNYLALNLSTK